jgi:predicted AlkP superfamily pyrophosphatase or phosphodiesterase
MHLPGRTSCFGFGTKFAAGLAWAAFISAVAMCSLQMLAALPASPATHHVVVISVDGMIAKYYAHPSRHFKIPNLQRLMKEGSYAEAVEGVYPSVTYASHTTIVTGKLPAEHGIYSNLSSREAGKNSEDWYWFSKAIKAPTLWDVARQHHLTTAAIAWPVTAGAAIDWDIPEIWDPAKPFEMDLTYLANYSTRGLLPEIMQALGNTHSAANALDPIREGAALYLLQKRRPNLLLLHLGDLDHVEHLHGPGSPEALAALEESDTNIGRILRGIRAARLDATTDVFVVSDHGFLPVSRGICPNVLLAKAGLLTVDANGRISGGKIATVSNGGSFFVYWRDGQDYRTAVDAALKPLRDAGILWAVLDHQAVFDLGADPGAKLALDAPEGYEFDASPTGAMVRNLPHAPLGEHGYLPFRPDLEASFLAWGPDIKPGIDLHRIRMTEVASTILRAMQVEDVMLGDEPPLTEIFRSDVDR